MEQGGRHADFRQGDTLEEGFLLDLSQLVWKLQDLQVLTMRKGTVHNFCDLCLREIHQVKPASRKQRSGKTRIALLESNTDSSEPSCRSAVHLRRHLASVLPVEQADWVVCHS